MDSNLKLLHIISDEKFPDAAYRQFEAVAPGASTYMLPENKKPIRHLKEIVPVRVSKYSFLNPRFITSMGRYDAVILHAMSQFALELVARAGDRVNFVWIGMGFDYYDLIHKDPYEMLAPETAQIVKGVLPKYGEKESKNPIKRFLKSIIYPNLKKKEKVIQKVSIFCPVLPSEAQTLESSLGELLPKILSWNYGAQSSLIDSERDFGWVTGKNILIGNSATPTNNHIEVFRKLSSLSLPLETKVIVPLSYGDKLYRDKIIELGKELLGDRFRPITEFMDFEQYVELLTSCPVIIMNHKRQQGAGNVGIGIYLGAKVFVSDESPLYRHYIDGGFTIFSIDDIEKALQEGVYGLDSDAALKNRCVLEEERGRKAHFQKTANLLSEIEAIDKEAAKSSPSAE